MADLQLADSSSYKNAVAADDVERTVSSLGSAGLCLQGAVDCLVFCHSPEAASSHAEYCKLRARLTTCAFLYRDLHLPLSTQLVRNLSNLMTLYETMDAPTFCEHIQVVAGEVKQAADHASKVIAVHVRLLEDLNTLHNDAQATLAMLELEATRLEKQAETYSQEGADVFKKENKAGKVMAGVAALWSLDAALFAGTPIIAGAYAAGASLYVAVSAHHHSKAKENLEKYNTLSTAAEKESEMAVKAAEIVRDPLMSTVKNFVQAIEQVAGFLAKLEGDTSNYASNAKRMAANKKSIVIYLNMLNSQSSKIQQACADYLQIMPAVEGRMGALSGIGHSDPNHVQKWLVLNFPDHNPATICQLLG